MIASLWNKHSFILHTILKVKVSPAGCPVVGTNSKELTNSNVHHYKDEEPVLSQNSCVVMWLAFIYLR